MYDVDGYLPVDVKVYTLFRDDEERPAKTLTSSLAEPGFDHAKPTAGTVDGHRRNAALQLAHYWRMLQACGKASARPAVGAIIDSGERLVWIDLNAPDARIQNKTTYEEEPVAWLRAYDHEFEFRRDVAAHTEQIKNGADLAPKVTPVAISECGSCEWNVHCRPELERRDHISLLPYMDYWAHRELRLRDVTSRQQVADLDYFTASVVKQLTAPQLKAVLDPGNADRPLTELWKRAPKAVAYAEALATDGIVSAGDLAERLTDTVVLDLGGKLNPAWIDQARASVLGTPLLARGFTSLDLPAHDVEVDFDMENDLAGNVYLWGLLATTDGTQQPYEVIDAYEPDVDGSGARLEGEVFLAFWNRVQQLREEATVRGKTFQMYYWSRAELTVAKRICDEPAIGGLPSADEIEGFFAESCTDLEAVLKAHFVMPSGTSVKKVAPLAGHDWSAVHNLADEDADGEGASGDVSMIKHRLAVEAPDEATREAAKLWLRTYNEQDVIATQRVRAWMWEAVATLPRADAEITRLSV
jgi:predicted RecB family nuclease